MPNAATTNDGKQRTLWVAVARNLSKQCERTQNDCTHVENVAYVAQFIVYVLNLYITCNLTHMGRTAIKSEQKHM